MLSEQPMTNQIVRNDHAVLVELNLEREWKGILGDKSELEFLAFAIRTL